MLAVAVPKRNKLQNIIVLTPKDGLAVAYIIELFGLFGVEKAAFEWRKVMGMLIAILGIVIFKWQK